MTTSHWFTNKVTTGLDNNQCRAIVGRLADLFHIYGCDTSPDDFEYRLLDLIGFEKFRKSAVELNLEDGADFCVDGPVRIRQYLGCLGICHNDGQFDSSLDSTKGKYHLILDRTEWLSDDLEELERRLFCWALTEGYTV